MVKITNNETTLEVSRGAFKSLFESKGWVIIGENEPEAQNVDLNEEKTGSEDLDDTDEETQSVDEEEDEDSTEEDDEDENEIPLSEMTVAQLKEYAKNNSIELKGANSRSAILEIIDKSEE